MTVKTDGYLLEQWRRLRTELANAQDLVSRARERVVKLEQEIVDVERDMEASRGGEAAFSPAS